MLEFQNLEFLGYPNYKMDNNGNIYRFKFGKCGLTEEQCDDIKNKKRNQNYTLDKLIYEFNISESTITRIINTNKMYYWKLVSPKPTHDGYLRTELYHKGKGRRYLHHRLVCEVFHGPCPKGMECRHLDGNKLNFSPENVTWGTHQENMQDKIMHNTDTRGEKHWGAKLKKQDIIMIRYLWDNKFCNQREIAKIYDIYHTTINKIVDRKTWKYI